MFFFCRQMSKKNKYTIFFFNEANRNFTIFSLERYFILFFFLCPSFIFFSFYATIMLASLISFVQCCFTLGLVVFYIHTKYLVIEAVEAQTIIPQQVLIFFSLLVLLFRLPYSAYLTIPNKDNIFCYVIVFLQELSVLYASIMVLKWWKVYTLCLAFICLLEPLRKATTITINYDGNPHEIFGKNVSFSFQIIDAPKIRDSS